MNADIKREKDMQKSSFDRIFELDNRLLEDGLRCKVINRVSTVDIRRLGRNGERYWREHV